MSTSILVQLLKYKSFHNLIFVYDQLFQQLALMEIALPLDRLYKRRRRKQVVW